MASPVNRTRRVNQTTTLRVGTRDRWRCHICQGGYDPHDPWELDHRASVVGLSGSDDDDNLGLSHRSCNRTKGTA